VTHYKKIKRRVEVKNMLPIIVSASQKNIKALSPNSDLCDTLFIWCVTWWRNLEVWEMGNVL